MNPLRILLFTSSRADYGFLCPLLDALSSDSAFEPLLLVCGSHLSEQHGMTVDEIRGDGRVIHACFDTLCPEPAETIALTCTAVAQSLAELRPDMLLLPGDRFELLGAASAALVARIPVIHYAGGQLTAGAWDDAVRHAVSKLSHLHFTACESYRQRIIQMGEEPDRVFVSGSLGLDNVLSMPRLSRAELQDQLGFTLNAPLALVTFHPATNDDGDPAEQAEELLAALDATPDLHTIITLPGADPGSEVIARKMEAYAGKNPERSLMVKSLGRKRYISALSCVDVVIGNSSSGLIEVPSFHIPTVNVGNRQQGRICASSVLHCPPRRHSISQAISRALTPEFRQSLAGVTNPYGDGMAAQRILAVLRRTNHKRLLNKLFHDLPMEPVP